MEPDIATSACFFMLSDHCLLISTSTLVTFSLGRLRRTPATFIVLTNEMLYINLLIS